MTRIRYLRDYLTAMKGQMNLFHTVNQDLLRLYEGRRVKVKDSFGNSIQGLFKGFSVSISPNKKVEVPEMFIHIQLVKKDGTPSNRTRMVNCEGAYIRLMGHTPRLAHP